jgi:hypothetical protein
MRRSENEKGAFKERYRKGAKFQKKKKKSAIIAVRRVISPGSIDCLKLIMRKSTISKRNEDEGLKRNLKQKDFERF